MINDFEKLYTDTVLENNELRKEKQEYHKRWRSAINEMNQMRQKVRKGKPINANIEIQKRLSKAKHDLEIQMGIFQKFFNKISKVEKPEDAMVYFRNAAEAVANEDLETMRRMGKALRVVGHCEICSISLYGHKKNAAPIETSLPCGVKGCAYDDKKPGLSLFKKGTTKPIDICKLFKVV